MPPSTRSEAGLPRPEDRGTGPLGVGSGAGHSVWPTVAPASVPCVRGGETGSLRGWTLQSWRPQAPWGPQSSPLLPTPASPSPLPSRPLLCAQKALSGGLATSVHLAVLPVMAKTPRRAGRLVKAGGGHGEKADETGQAWAGGEGLRPQPPLWEPPPPRPTVAPCRLSTRTRPHHRLAKAGGAVTRTPPSPLPPSSTLNSAEPTVVPAGAQGPHPRAAVLT